MPSKKLKLKCKNCGKEYYRYRIKNRPQIFCSRECYLHSVYNAKIHYEIKINTNQICDRNPNWKGDQVSYKGIHRWVENNFGKAKDFICALCHGTSGSTKMNWMNLDHKYTRNKEKWIPACKKCHSQYDKVNFNCYAKLKTLI
jgi:hypothetical protein